MTVLLATVIILISRFIGSIDFDKSFTMLFQSPRPPEHTREFKFSSTAYWYQQSASELLYKLPSKDKLVDLYRIRDTDHQSIP
jgi:hypothetical protein